MFHDLYFLNNRYFFVDGNRFVDLDCLVDGYLFYNMFNLDYWLYPVTKRQRLYLEQLARIRLKGFYKMLQ